MAGNDCDLRFFWVWVGLVLSLPVLAGCADSNRAPLSGRWELATPEKLAGRLGPESQKGTAETADTGSAAGMKMVLEFGSWGELKTVTRVGAIDREKMGRWEVIERAPDGSRMTIRCTLNRQTTEHDVEFLEEDRIRLIPPNLAGTKGRLEFRRAN